MTTDAQISDREREILQLVANGATNQQIAQELSISVNTVKVHLRNIFSKIGVVSRTEATLYAVRNGLIQIHEEATPSRVEEPPVADDLAGQDEEPPPQSAQAAHADLSSATTPDASTPAVPDTLVEHAALRNEPVSPQVPMIVPTNVTGDSTTIDVSPPALPRPRQRVWLGRGISGLIILLLAGLAFVALQTRPFGQSTEPTTDDTAEAQEFDTRWNELAPMPMARAGFALANYQSDGRAYLYVIGGETSDSAVSDQIVRYDVGADVWTQLSAKPTAVSNVQAVVVGKRVYIPGGQLASGESTDIFEVYDPQRDQWESLAPLPAPRSGYALAALEGKIYLFGGWDGQTYADTVWQYNPDQDSWEDRAAMSTARAFAGSVVINSQIYVLGGEDSSGKLTLNESYTPAEDTGSGNPWSLKAPIPSSRSRMGIAAVDDLVFVLGGADDDAVSLLYRSAVDSWELRETPLSTTLEDMRATDINKKLYILGGREGTALSASTYEYQAIFTVLVPVQ